MLYRTQEKAGFIIPVEISVYKDRSFTFILKTPPATDLLKKAANITSGSKNSKTTKVATISKAKLREVAETKMPDLNASNIEAAMSVIAGSARSIGIVIGE